MRVVVEFHGPVLTTAEAVKAALLDVLPVHEANIECKEIEDRALILLPETLPPPGPWWSDLG
jgi:hypothetical protein